MTVHPVFRDLRAAHCDMLTLGQYLQPTRQHLPVVRYVEPDEFSQLRAVGLSAGFKHVENMCTLFRNKTDQTPGQYRKESQSQGRQ